jgi:hypothetical protein
MNTEANNPLYNDLEELEMTLACAEKVKFHLNRLILQESKIKYVNNLQVLDDMIGSFEIQYGVAV